MEGRWRGAGGTDGVGGVLGGLMLENHSQNTGNVAKRLVACRCGAQAGKMQLRVDPRECKPDMLI